MSRAYRLQGTGVTAIALTVRWLSIPLDPALQNGAHSSKRPINALREIPQSGRVSVSWDVLEKKMGAEATHKQCL